MNKLTATLNKVVVIDENLILAQLGCNLFRIPNPDIDSWKSCINRTIQVTFDRLREIDGNAYLEVKDCKLVKSLSSTELTILEGTVSKVSLVPNNTNAINIEIGGITVGAARIPLLNVVGVPVRVSLTTLENLTACRYYWVKLKPRTSILGRVWSNLKEEGKEILTSFKVGLKKVTNTLMQPSSFD